MSGPSAALNAVLAAAKSSECASCAWSKASRASTRLQKDLTSMSAAENRSALAATAADGTRRRGQQRLQQCWSMYVACFA